MRSEYAGATRRRGPRALQGLPFVLPYLPLLIVFGIAPTIYALDLAFTNFDGGWAGFHNFVKTYHDFRFIPAFKHIFIYTIVWLGSLMVLVVTLALLLHGRANRVSSAYRFLFYIPGALAGAAAVVIWLFMLDPTVSPASFLLRDVLGAQIFAQSIAPQNLPYVFAMIAFWTGAGGWIVVMYGALNNISADLLEAARIDGANAWQTAWRVQIPLLRKWIVYMVILAFAGGTQLFVEPQLLAQASVGVAGRDYSLNQLSYDFAFQNDNVDTAAAISVELLLIGLVVAAVFVVRSGFFDAD